MEKIWDAPPPRRACVTYFQKQQTLASGRKKGLAAIILALVFVLMALPAVAFAEGSDNSGKITAPEGQTQLVDWSRLAGDSRFDTMAAISQDGFEHVDTVVVASGENFPDALSATALAGYFDSPVLLSGSSELAAQCASEIERLGATKAIVIGGTAAISDAAFAQIEKIVGKGSVERLAGDDRFATSQAIYDYGKKIGAWGSAAVVASGVSFVDALAMSPWAYASGAPIFLADDSGSLSDKSFTAIRDGGFNRVIIAGGIARIIDDTQASLADIVGSSNVERLAGHTRYDTSQQVVVWAVQNGLTYKGSAVATGSNFPDALSGGALCGYRESVLMLVDEEESAYSGAIGALADNKLDVYESDVLGGTSALSDNLYAKLQRTTLAKTTALDFSLASVDTSAKVYTGSAINPKVSIEGLVEGRDYTVEYGDNTAAGIGTVTVKGVRNYTGEKVYEFNIVPADITLAIAIDAPDVVYDGLAHEANVTVLGGLVKDSDYTVTHTANIDAGKVTVTVSGCDNYTGQKVATFEILPYDISGAALTFANNGKTYLGSNIEAGSATVTLKEKLADNTITLAADDYTLTGITQATDAGTYTVYATGKGNFTGTVTGTWVINKADLPVAMIPANLETTATAGDKLSDVELPTVEGGTLVWKDVTDTVGDEAGTAQRSATFTSSNASYNPVDVTVKIAVTLTTYAVTFDYDDGVTTSTAATVKAGDGISNPPADPEREGYAFLGWYVVGSDNKTTDELVDLSAYVPAGDVTLRAVWTDEYTVVYHSNGGYNDYLEADESGEYTYTHTFKVTDAKSTLKPNNFVKDGKTFQYWTLGVSDSKATETTITYADGHSLANGGMLNNEGNAAAAGDVIDLYTHWADASTDDYWIASATAEIPDSAIEKDQDGVNEEVETASVSGVSDVLKGYMDSDEGNDKIDADTMHLFTYWYEDKALPLADRYVEFRIVEVGEHLNVAGDDGSGDGSGVTFMATHSLPTAQQFNEDDTNSGGWKDSHMRTEVIPAYVKDNLSEGFVSSLATVTKMTVNDEAVSKSSIATSTEDSIWMMSYNEITGNASNNSDYTAVEGAQYAWCAENVKNGLDNNDSIKDLHLTRSGSSPESLYETYVWERSPTLSFTTAFMIVSSAGDPGNAGSHAIRRLGVCPAFAM